MTAAELVDQMMDALARTEYPELRAVFVDGAKTDHTGTSEFARFISESIDPGMVVDFSQYRGLVPDQERFRHGRQGFLETWRVFLAPWSRFEVAQAQVEELDPGRALAWAIWRLKGEASGVDVELPTCAIWHTRNDRFVKMQGFADVEDAREWLG